MLKKKTVWKKLNGVNYERIYILNKLNKEYKLLHMFVKYGNFQVK